MGTFECPLRLETLGASPLLGAYTLEGLRLQVDPVHQKLVPLVGRI